MCSPGIDPELEGHFRTFLARQRVRFGLHCNTFGWHARVESSFATAPSVLDARQLKKCQPHWRFSYSMRRALKQRQHVHVLT